MKLKIIKKKVLFCMGILQKRRKIESLLFLVILLAFNMNIKAQVAINEDNSDANVKAALDIKSTTKGVLFPNLSETQRNALPSPATGLIIFNRTVGYFNFYNGSQWCRINRTVVLNPAINPVGAASGVGVGIGIADPDNSAILHVNANNKGVLVPRLTGAQVTALAAGASETGMIVFNLDAPRFSYYDGAAWLLLSGIIQGAADATAGTAEGVVIGNTTINASAKLELVATDKGLLIPRMTTGLVATGTAGRDDIPSPAEGLLIYNITVNNLQYFCDNTWWSLNTMSDYGMISANPGSSCKNIYVTNTDSQGFDGTYWIDPDGVGGNPAYQCTCDMTRDGGGWTLVQNSGPKMAGSTSGGNYTIAAIGAVSPITTSNAAAALAKLSDVDVNLLRGGAPGYATSILRVERQNSCSATKLTYFVENKAYNTLANTAQSIQTFYETYANAIALVNLRSPTNNAYSAPFESWTCAAAPTHTMIFNYLTEGVITSGCNSTTVCAAVNRSECSVLVWIKY